MSDDYHRCDVLVCGGGPGGIAAAVAAARNGADTLLVERYGFLGGMATAGLVNPFMPYYAGDEQIIQGIFQEMLGRLGAYGAYGSENARRYFDTEIMKIVCDEICVDSGVRLLLHTYVSGVNVSDSLIQSIQTTSKSGPQSLSAKVYVDATGDADVAYLAGVPCEKGREEDGLAQPMTLCFDVAGVDIPRMPERDEINRLYLQARDEGRIDCLRENVLLFRTLRDDTIHFNTTRIVCSDATSAEDLTRAEIDSRRQMKQIVAFLKSDVSGFENAHLLVSATQIGVRESRRIVGEYVMTVEDVLEARKFDDCVARGSYPVDIHNPTGSGTVIRHLPPGESYDIPYRSLVPLGVDNLLVAGRPISSTHEAHSSIRIMPIAFAIGEAAGTAAAMCAGAGASPRTIDIAALQRELIAQGANLGRVRRRLGMEVSS